MSDASVRSFQKSSAPGGGGNGPGQARPGAALPTRQRRPAYVGLAVVLIVGLAALGAWSYQRAGAKTPVVMVVHQVDVGHVISRRDLSTVSVAGGVTAIAAEHLDSVVGETAAVTLLPNTLLQRSMVATASSLKTGQAQVGVAVGPGQLPADGVQPGDVVEVLRIPEKDSVDAEARVLVQKASVFSARADSSQSGGTLVTLVVPMDAAAAIAAASGAGQVALVEVPGS